MCGNNMRFVFRNSFCEKCQPLFTTSCFFPLMNVKCVHNVQPTNYINTFFKMLFSARVTRLSKHILFTTLYILRYRRIKRGNQYRLQLSDIMPKCYKQVSNHTHQSRSKSSGFQHGQVSMTTTTSCALNFFFSSYVLHSLLLYECGGII